MGVQYVEKGVWTPIKFNEFTSENQAFDLWYDENENQYQDGQNIRAYADMKTIL